MLLFAELLLELHIKSSEYGRGCCWSLWVPELFSARCRSNNSIFTSILKFQLKFFLLHYSLWFFSSLSPLKHNSNQGEQNELNFWTCSAYAILKWSEIGSCVMEEICLCGWNFARDLICKWIFLTPSKCLVLLRLSDLCHTHGYMLFSLISVSSTASGPSCWIAPKLGFR